MADKKDKESLKTFEAKFDRWWNSAYNNRNEIDWKWFIYDLWVSGNHYAKWDRNTQQIISTLRDKGKPKVVINKIYTTLRAVRNYSLRNQPKPEVTPYNWNPKNLDEARDLSKYLEYLHDRLYLRYKLKASVWHALKYSVGAWQVVWDEQAEDKKGEVAVRVVDPYDLYFDPNATDPKDARYVFLAVRRSIFDLLNDDKYIKEEVEQIKTEKKVAASPLKSRLLVSEKGQFMGSTEESAPDEGSVIVKECWYIKYVNGQKQVWLCTKAGDRTIRKPFNTGLTRIPFFILSSDIEPLSIYGTGWVKNLIPVNRQLDRLESSLAEYNDLVNKGKYVADKGSGVRVINNEHGQIIEKKRGYEVAHLPIAPISPIIMTQIQQYNTYIEDIGGAHEASMGRIPTGVKSGKGIEALQVGDANNMSELVENIEVFLEEVYEYILSLVAQKYQFARNITPTTTSGEREVVQVIGEDANNIPDNTLVIKKKNVVDVKITSWLATTTLAKQEILMELYNAGVIDKQTLLEGYQIGSIADILGRLEQEKVDAAATQIATEKASQPAPTQAGQQQAIAIIRSIINGQQPPEITPEMITPEFTGYFDQFMQSPEAQSLDSNTLNAIQAFRDQLGF